jgi:hypothetical protein
LARTLVGTSGRPPIENVSGPIAVVVSSVFAASSICDFG